MYKYMIQYFLISELFVCIICAKDHSTDLAFELIQNLTLRLQHVEEALEISENRRREAPGNLFSLDHIIDGHLPTNREAGTPIAFTAQNQHDLENLGDGQTVVFDSVVTNAGNGYDPRTGIFKAPISGIYGFFFDIRVFEHSHICWIDLVKDGSKIVMTWAKGNPETYGHESNSNFALIRLSEGDKVWLKNAHYKHFSCSIDDLSAFSGFFLYYI